MLKIYEIIISGIPRIYCKEKADAEEMLLALWQEERHRRYMTELHCRREYDEYARLYIHNPVSYENYILECFWDAEDALEWVDWRFKEKEETQIKEHELF